MIPSTDNYTVVTPKSLTIEAIAKTVPSLDIFDDAVLAFLQSLSKEFLRQKAYGEIVALGFWLRDSHIKKLKKRFERKHEGAILMPKGVVFHIAPSNVDTIFLYSLILSLLAGNMNILRIGERRNPQLDAILATLLRVLANHPVIAEHIVIIRYAHDDAITAYLSKLCDVRIIWGGDATIEHIRTLAIPPYATELVFADKFSFAVIDPNGCDFDTPFFEKFYRDGYTFLQNACSSVRTICWLNADKEQKEAFWNGFETFVEQKMPPLEAKQTVDKLTALALQSATTRASVTCNKFIHRIALRDLDDIDTQLHCGFGLFYEVDIGHIDTLLRYATRKNQTLAVAGIEREKIIDAIKTTRTRGFDRIVALGEANSFEAVWDGYDILSSLVRIVDVAL